MRVFLSWSGPASRAVADALNEWLPDVLPDIEPFLSVDIEKGARWNEEIAKQLEVAKVGIVCLTPDNLASRWILFEAGALSKTLTDARVCTYLLGVEPEQVKPPLAQFMATRANEEETRRLVGDINKVLGDEAREEKRVERAFEKNWPDLKAKLAAIPPPKAAPHRPPEEMLAEVLEVVRGLARRPERSERPDTSARGVITGDTVASPALDFLEMSRAEHARRQAVLRATGGLGLGGRVADLEALNAWKTEGAKAVAAVDAMSAQFADGAKAVDAMNARLAEGAKAVNAMSETFAEAEKLAAKLDALNDPIQLKKDDKKS